MKKIYKIRKAIDKINETDETGLIIVNFVTYNKLRNEDVNLIFGVNYPFQTIFGIPIVAENMKEDCIVLSKNTLKKLGELYGK